MTNNYIDIITEFLNTPLDCLDQIFERFAALPGAVVGTGEKHLQRYVYIPGIRDDRVLLVAHIDTVWDKAYTSSCIGENGAIFEDGVFRSSNQNCGIGADDRAGCAMLWALRNCGHSILIVAGEEHGKVGARYLKKTNKSLFRELNRHCFMIELDWAGTDGCLFNQVDNTKKFKKHIEEKVGFLDSRASGGTDLQVLCKNVCGVNIGVGYHGQHRNNETLVLSEWENTIRKLSDYLERPQRRFRISIRVAGIRFSRRIVGKILRILKIKNFTQKRRNINEHKA